MAVRLLAMLRARGVIVATFMAAMYALESRGPQFILAFAFAFACGCLLSSAYAFLGVRPLDAVEVIWAAVAVQRYCRVPG